MSRIPLVALGFALSVGSIAVVPLIQRSFGSTSIVKSAQAPTSRNEASRFLIQATFGPSDASISDLSTTTYSAWITAQEAMPVSESHLAFLDSRIKALRQSNPKAILRSADFYYSFWKQSISAPDQLRQRMKLALSEIFVVSFRGASTDARGMSAYYDMLGTNSFGNYRDLIENVTFSPMMGLYLTYIGNAKEDSVTGRHPDENYAREILQLMSIGLYQLNQDGTLKRDGNGAPIRTYGVADIQGLAKVFTGVGYWSSKPTATGPGGGFDPNVSTVVPMIVYEGLHSTSEKSFLGTTIPASATPDTRGDIKIALDTIFNHPNVGPFVGRQLIQRFVTSNPSPAYVSRVAAVFNDNGSGVRGDLAAVLAAILLDPEARAPDPASLATYGKIREPIVRLANWARAFNATSATGAWTIPDTTLPDVLNQDVLSAPSVFNFWRPGYSPPETALASQGMVAPEFQAIDEVAAAGYLNTIQSAVDKGLGTPPPGMAGTDVRSDYVIEMGLARAPADLINRMDLLLLAGQMSPALRARVTAGVNSVALPGAAATTAQINTALLNRAKTAIFLTMASPEYLAQR